MSECWRYGCPECGSVVLYRRVEAGGWRCGECYAVFPAEERVDRTVADRSPVGSANAR